MIQEKQFESISETSVIFQTKSENFSKMAPTGQFGVHRTRKPLIEPSLVDVEISYIDPTPSPLLRRYMIPLDPLETKEGKH